MKSKKFFMLLVMIMIITLGIGAQNLVHPDSPANFERKGSMVFYPTDTKTYRPLSQKPENIKAYKADGKTISFEETYDGRI